jgi:hypothetical protein
MKKLIKEELDNARFDYFNKSLEVELSEWMEHSDGDSYIRCRVVKIYFQPTQTIQITTWSEFSDDSHIAVSEYEEDENGEQYETGREITVGIETYIHEYALNATDNTVRRLLDEVISPKIESYALMFGLEVYDIQNKIQF